MRRWATSQAAGAIERRHRPAGRSFAAIMARRLHHGRGAGNSLHEIAPRRSFPAILYFVSVYFQWSNSQAQARMRGRWRGRVDRRVGMMKQVFLPYHLILIVARIMGYSVIRAGNARTRAAAVVSWLTPYRWACARFVQGVRAGRLSCRPDHRGLRPAGHHVWGLLAARVGAPVQSNLCLDLAEIKPASGAVLRECAIAILLGHGDAHDRGPYCGAPPSRRGARVSEIEFRADGAFFVFYFAWSGHHAAVALAVTPRRHLGPQIRWRPRWRRSRSGLRLHVSLHVLLQFGLLLDGTGRSHPRRRHATFGVFLLSAAVQGCL